MNRNCFRLIDILDFMSKLPSDCHPRIGGSCAMWIIGKEDNFRDVDIICDYIPKDINWKLETLPNKHEKRLNKTVAYSFRGERIELHESLFPRKNDGLIEDLDNIICARKKIKEFLKDTYNENINKWED